ncbi:FixH family protein [Brevibacillus ginsengisoli]|uniref:FixH family protein n=1 Tax=Brevibacillus ginsengisoli TaxID=363854 RepID=UPI003CF0BC80
MRTICMMILLVIMGVLAGCGGQSQEGSVQQGEYFSVSLEPAVSPVPTGQEVKYTVQVTHEGEVVTKAQVQVALEMKEMDHGKNEFALKEVQPGVYEGKAVLPMSGTWQAYIRIAKDGKSETIPATFEAVGEMVKSK